MKKNMKGVPPTPEEAERIVALAREHAPIKTDDLVVLLYGGHATERNARHWKAKIQGARSAGLIAYAKLDREFFIAPTGWVEPLQSVIQRIHGRVKLDKDTGCLLWTERLDSGSRALIFSLGKSYMARRVLFNDLMKERKGRQLRRYQTLEPTCACEGHCIEPTHMRVLEHSTVLKRIERPAGFGAKMALAARPHAKLNEEMVADMRAKRGELTVSQISALYPQVSFSTVSLVLRGKIWKDYSLMSKGGQPATPFTGLVR